MFDDSTAPRRKLAAKSLVALRSDPSRHGVILNVSRDGRTVCVQFDNYPRPTVHAAEGLVLVSTTSQLGLFTEKNLSTNDTN